MQVTFEIYKRIVKLKKAKLTHEQIAKHIGSSLSTVEKYCNLTEEQYLKRAHKGIEARRQTLRPYILSLLEENASIKSTEIHEILSKKFADYNCTLKFIRELIKQLRKAENIPYVKAGRKFVRRAEAPMGEEAQVDMGQIVIDDIYGNSVKVYIFAMVLSHSRMKFFTLRMTPFDSVDFANAHRLAFKFYGGRTRFIMYDQDRVMVVSENAGDIVYTKAFEALKSEVGFDVYLCNKQDPDTKGKIENVIKYIKYNFFKDKVYTNIENLNGEALIWLDEVGNGKIHSTTLKKPKDVFIEERKYLIPVKDAAITTPRAKYRLVSVDGVGTIRYLTNFYTLPKDRYKKGDKVKLECCNGVIKLYDRDTDECVAEHVQLYSRGSISNYKRKINDHKVLVSETLEVLGNSDSAIEFVTAIQEKMPRYIRQQCNMLQKISKSYDIDEIESAMKWCISNYVFTANELLSCLIAEQGIEKACAIMPARSKSRYIERSEVLMAYDKLID